MFETLRSRFILSHILPLLLVIPLMGITLTYVLETQVILENLSAEMEGQAVVLAAMLSQRSDIWTDQSSAQSFLRSLDPHLGAHVTLLDAGGYLLASNDPDDARYVGQVIETPAWTTILAGQVSVHTGPGRGTRTESVYVIVPVLDARSQLAGAVRLSNQLSGVSARFSRLRYWTGGVMAAGLGLGIAAGWVLAVNLARPLRQVTRAVRRLSTGEELEPLPEKGPREIRLLSQSVNALVLRLQNLERARRQLLANLVHELGRPLGALRSATEALRNGADEDPALQHDLLAGMDGELHRMHRLVDDLAGMYSQAMGILELRWQRFDIVPWLLEVLTPWREAAQEKDLTWQVDVPEGLPAIDGDPDRLAQALGNVIGNAIKFTAPGGKVSTAAGVEGNELWIRVSDTGPGIEPEERDLIFKPFYRGQAAQRFPQGMGLGLSIAHELVTAHGGRLELDSHPEQGSRFTVRLPVRGPELPAGGSLPGSDLLKLP